VTALQLLIVMIYRSSINPITNLGNSSGLQRRMDWTLWRGWPPPKRKKQQHLSRKSRIWGSTSHSRSYGPHCCKREGGESKREREREGERKEENFAL
jgi:hypothetical protein